MFRTSFLRQQPLMTPGCFRGFLPLLIVFLAFAVLPNATFGESDDEFFEAKVRPLLVQRCAGCHSNEKGKTKGGLALDTSAGWQKGGESGPAIVPGRPHESLLMAAVEYRDDGPQMPPQDAGGKLPASEIEVLREWIRRGAHDPRTSAARRGGLTEQELQNWWSFQPLQPVTVPSPPPPPGSEAISSENEIDQFLLQRLAEQGLTFAAEADRRTWIRRASFDLTGLPPTAEEVDAFVNDASPDAYQERIDSLLESPRYGERWGRHWLDLVRYADTAGENTDHPIPDAWRYRNWVIDAINSDRPYNQFVREQIAGDLLHANDTPDKYAEGVIATGFLAIARRFDHDSDKHMHLTYEDTIDVMGRTFLGLSIACARCHDHKYDPISSKDYYALYGILNSTRYAFPGCEAKQQPRDLVPLLSPAEWKRQIEPYDQQLAQLDAELKQLQDSVTAAINSFKTAANAAGRNLAQGSIAEGGSQLLAEAGQVLQTVALKKGHVLLLTIDPAGNYGADTTLMEWQIAESDGEQRRWNLTEDVVGTFLDANPHADRYGNSGTWMFLDARGGPSLLSETVKDLSGKSGLNVWRSGENPSVFVNSTEQPLAVWTTLPARSLFVHPAADGPVAVAWISPIDGIVSVTGRVEDAHPGGPNGVGWRIDHLAEDHTAAIEALVKTAVRRAQLMAERNERVAHAPARDVAYAVTEGTIGNVRQHLRGDPEQPGEEIPRRWLELFGGETLPENTGSGRLQLAGWLSDAANPLAARVMVNRLWQHHFGKGIVQTPNDFGTRGQLPTHPELLDWLAGRFIDSGWSLKSMHRLIMMSAAYRQSAGDPSSGIHSSAMHEDPGNTLYWRFDRRRLSAEELRDTLLTISQQIDLTPDESHPVPPTPGWSFTQHNPFTGVPETNHRTIYLMILRNRRHSFMGLFDGADPNATTPLRQVTTVPTQSLFFLNDEFFHNQAHLLARRVLNDAGEFDQLDRLYEIVFQRSPAAAEREAAESFLASYAQAVAELPAEESTAAVWSAWARVLLSSNEFLYLD